MFLKVEESPADMAPDPGTYLQQHNEAIMLARAGKFAEARKKLLALIRGNGDAQVDARSLKALWQVAQNEGDWRTALAAGFRAATIDPLDFPFVNRVALSLAAAPLEAIRSGGTPSLMPISQSMPSLSVVIVSQDDARHAAVTREYDAAFAQWPHQRIRIKGAASMYEGYARGFAQATGDIVVFSHDDIRFAVPDFAARLADVMSYSDFAGVAGTTNLGGPALLWSGHPHLHGAITHSAAGRAPFEFGVLSLSGPRIAAAQALDGVFIAARRDWVERIGFDTTHISGFHFYDLDFTYRAFAAGARMTIANDLGLIHRSRGEYGSDWVAAQAVFQRKHPQLAAEPGSHRHWYTLELPDELAVARHHAKLNAAWQLELA